MSNAKVEDWWSGNDYLSDVITPDSWFAVMKDWDSWRKSGHRMFFRGESACLNEDCSNQEGINKPGESLLSCSYKPYPLLPSLLRDQNFTNLSQTWGSSAGDAKKLERQLLEHYIIPITDRSSNNYSNIIYYKQ